MTPWNLRQRLTAAAHAAVAAFSDLTPTQTLRGVITLLVYDNGGQMAVGLGGSPDSMTADEVVELVGSFARTAKRELR